MNAQQLRNSILQEAIEGRLVPQDPNDEPASALLERIREEKRRLVKEGKLKKKDLVETPISEDEKPFEIPEGWEWCKISSILLLLTDGTHNSPPSFSEGDYMYITAKNIKSEGIDLTNVTYVSKEIHQDIYSRCNPEYGDILYIKDGATAGVVTLNNLKQPFSLLSSVALLKQSRQMHSRYLLAYLNSPYCYNTVRASMKGAAITRITLRMIKDWVIPIPPIQEQERIASKVDSILPYLEEYGKAQEALDKLNAELPEKLKKSILQEAIEGRLVPQDPNDEPASVLLDKIRKEKAQLVKEGKLKKKDLVETPISEDEKPFEIPEGWEWCRLGTIATLIGGFAFKSHEYASSGSRVIRISDITEKGFINKNVVRYPFTDKLSQYVILEGDILMAMTGGTVGKSLYVKYVLEENMLLNQRVGLIRVKNVFVDYIDYVIKSQHIQGIITEAKNSTNDNISMVDINNFPIPLPPLAEQHRIVERIEKLMGGIEML